MIHIAKAANGITVCFDTPSESNGTTASQPASRSASSMGKCLQHQCPANLDPTCWTALCKLAADVPALENLPQAVKSDASAWTSYASEDGDGSRRPALWLRQTPPFPLSTDDNGEEGSTREKTLAERCLIALCWKPASLRAAMQVQAHSPLHAFQVYSCACCFFVLRSEHPVD